MPKKSKDKLTDHQIEIGAKYLTMSNLGQLRGEPTSEKNVIREYQRCEMNHEMEGIDITDEYKHWVKVLKKRDQWTIDQVKLRLPFLFI